jgi:ABC-2 type transport system ATP-binding protein
MPAPEEAPLSIEAPPAIRARGLTRDFGRLRAVDGLELAVRPGELYGFLGPNGAGKTTTIRMLNGLLRPSAGELRVLGHDLAREADAVRRVTALVPDTPPLYDELTGWQYVAFVGSLYGDGDDEREAEARRLFELFELTAAQDALCKGYSHGMRKKLHVAAMLVTRPKVLFLDEPTTGLDPRAARRLKDLLLEQRAQGVTVFLSTHLLELAQELCDRVGILSRGRLLAEGSVEELLASQGERHLEEVFLRLTEEGASGAGAAAG